ncbi:transcription elongation factor GreB [Marinobacter arenosus]|uniref:transcription elongation factor GreB n=1 Tax=Marinobacter arenosus TaxID=2856822 RepID=UPI001C4AC706|nr:transcription elongation factor GreB [Marinobacter arenosus]MBW0147878.1 transcription elongation factor GreB [Marinobacter arenosus]
MKTNLITREGFHKLQEELDFLWRTERPDVTRKVTWAASLGDRSENADYQYNKRRLREIDRRVRHIRNRLENVRIVDYAETQEGRVFFGAWVRLVDDETSLTFRIVGPDEIYERKDYVSIDAPIARACLKKEEDDEVIVRTPMGEKTWYVDRIWYEAGEA